MGARDTELAGRVSAHRDYFEVVAREYERGDFVAGAHLCARWLELIEGRTTHDEALVLYLELDALWLGDHFGASGWGALRSTMLHWLIGLLGQTPSPSAEIYRVLASSLDRHFERHGAELGTEGRALCARWLLLLDAADIGQADALVRDVEHSTVAGRVAGDGLAALIRMWRSRPPS